jgi:hypothetical protein
MQSESRGSWRVHTVFSVEARCEYSGKSRFFEGAAAIKKINMDKMAASGWCVPGSEKTGKNGG